jgi:hypothetical protein
LRRQEKNNRNVPLQTIGLCRKVKFGSYPEGIIGLSQGF